MNKLATGDLVVLNEETQFFPEESSWTPGTFLPRDTVCVVICARQRTTGAGRQWHYLLSTQASGWIEGPGFVRHVRGATP